MGKNKTGGIPNMKFSKEELTERMHSGKLYFCDDPALAAEQLIWLDKVYDYNALKPSQQEEKKRLLKEMFAEIGEGCYLETPFYANWGGRHVHLGDGVYANFNLTLVDDCEIFIGDHVMIGPNVVLATGTHPVNPRLRYQQAQYNLPIHIEENVWIGAGSVVLPGVTIGKNSVIGAGSVVTKDIPANVVAAGSPCRILRQIGELDQQYYAKDLKIDL